jgi:hypothetical protein
VKIWLDDVRDPPDDSWTHLRTGRALAGMLLVHEGDVEIVSFDHDLADFQPDPMTNKMVEFTGYTWLKQIESMVASGALRKLPKLVVHSANPVGRKNMEAAIRSAYKLAGMEPDNDCQQGCCAC